MPKAEFFDPNVNEIKKDLEHDRKLISPSTSEVNQYRESVKYNLDRYKVIKGIGGVYNTPNINAYQYAAWNPVRFIDPDGKVLQFKDSASEKSLKPAIQVIMKSAEGQKLLAKLHADKNVYTIEVNNKGELYQQGNKVTIDPSAHPTIQTDKGPKAASTARILAHELGHLTGTSDDGPNDMNNVNKNENPVMKPIEGFERTAY